MTNKPFGVNITLLPTINPPDYAGYCRVAVEEGVKVFETAGNNREWYPRCPNSLLNIIFLNSQATYPILETEWLHRDP